MVCNTCNIDKPEDQFYSCFKSGKKYLRHKCKECYYKHNKNTVAHFRKSNKKYKIAYQKRFKSEKYKLTPKYTYTSHRWLSDYFKYSDCPKDLLETLKLLRLLKKNIKKHEELFRNNTAIS